MSGNRNPEQSRNHFAMAETSSDTGSQWRETRTRLNKNILKLIFSHLGRNDELDDTIKAAKTRIQQSRTDEERYEQIETAIDEILRSLDAEEMAGKKSRNKNGEPELFLELLNKLILSHDQADEFLKLRNRVRNIREQKEHLEVVNETIRLLSANPESAGPDSKELVLNLIEYIRLPRKAAEELEKIKQKIHRISDAGGLTRQLIDVSEVINQASEQLQDEFRDIRQYITGVIGQLGQLNEYITGSINDEQQALAESQELKKRFLVCNESLQMKIDSSSNVEEIKQCVNAHITTVNENLKTHMEMESKRHATTDNRLKTLRMELGKMHKQCDFLKEKLVHAKKEAMHDVLTGLPNRLALNERFRDEEKRYQRYRHPMSLAVLDIDHFKKVNDTWGHKAGDKVLKAVAEVCGNNIRSADFLARFGGEEFVILIPETPLDQACNAMESLRAIIEECHFHYGDQSVPITVSIGVAEFRHGDSGETVFQRADDALYAAKKGGRNRCLSEEQLESVT